MRYSIWFATELYLQDETVSENSYLGSPRKSVPVAAVILGRFFSESFHYIRLGKRRVRLLKLDGVQFGMLSFSCSVWST